VRLLRRLRPSAAALAIVLVAVAVLVGAWLLLRDGGDGDIGAAGDDGIAVNAAVTPVTHLFGDPITARVEVLLQRDRFDPERVRLAADFSPYEQSRAIRRSRQDVGSVTRLLYTVEVRCLTQACFPQQVKQAYRFRPARVLYDDPERLGRPRLLARTTWPRVEISSRLRESQIARLRQGEISTDQPTIELDWRADLTALREPTFRFSPVTGSWVLFAAAALLLLLAGLLVRRALKAPLTRQERRLLRMSPLERALLLVDHAGGREAAEARLALDRLAAELPSEEAGLDQEARQLAWSERDPGLEDASSLAARVRERLNGRRSGRRR
jgi:hypothetical protein